MKFFRNVIIFLLPIEIITSWEIPDHGISFRNKFPDGMHRGNSYVGNEKENTSPSPRFYEIYRLLRQLPSLPISCGLSTPFGGIFLPRDEELFSQDLPDAKQLPQLPNLIHPVCVISTPFGGIYLPGLRQ
ncbi:hypothetical protein HHI36_001952 [Cryptolaemus montrouzieri]|uniref:Uncharacterized protein n=1 Tax=Cryptolaemus montrouzieri TaxID=559131 RepID=A0ABD2P9W7_9CUCU